MRAHNMHAARPPNASPTARPQIHPCSQLMSSSQTHADMHSCCCAWRSAAPGPIQPLHLWCSQAAAPCATPDTLACPTPRTAMAATSWAHNAAAPGHGTLPMLYVQQPVQPGHHMPPSWRATSSHMAQSHGCNTCCTHALIRSGHAGAAARHQVPLTRLTTHTARLPCSFQQASQVITACQPLPCTLCAPQPQPPQPPALQGLWVAVIATVSATPALCCALPCMRYSNSCSHTSDVLRLGVQALCATATATAIPAGYCPPAPCMH